MGKQKGHNENWVYREPFQVRSYDADLSGMLTLETFARYLQETAYQHAEKLGFGYHRLNANGMTWMMSRIHIRLSDPPQWGEEVEVETWPKGKDRLLYLRDFRLLGRKSGHLGSVTSSWMVIDKERRRPASFKPLDAMISDLPDRHAIRTPAAKLTTLTEPVDKVEIEVFPSDIDVNGHVNFTRYIRWCCDNTLKALDSVTQLREITLNFLSELHLGDQVELHRQRFPSGNSFLFSVVNKGLNTESARVLVEW